MFWVVIAVLVATVAFMLYATGHRNGTQETQRYWQQIAVDAGFAEWKTTRDGRPYFWWRDDDLIVKHIDEKKRPVSPTGR